MDMTISVDELLAQLSAGPMSPDEIYAIGLQLAEIGDPRPGVGVLDNGLPDIDWVTIPAGEFLRGSRMGDLTANLTEVPQSSVHLPAYRISRYPVTYAQFEAFVSGEGYARKSYWTGAGNRWRIVSASSEQRRSLWRTILRLGHIHSDSGHHKSQPDAFWNDPDWHVSNHPVVGVTWYEAAAFCNWLGDQLGLRVWLPDESQWEKAARGTDGRRFPWGRQFYPSNANCGQTVQVDRFNRDSGLSGVGRTTAVGLYVEGASPYGVLDVAGNVWEWCATAWNEHYDEPEDNDPEGDAPRAIRGGGWNEREVQCRTTSRKGQPPQIASNNLGFRVCAEGT